MPLVKGQRVRIESKGTIHQAHVHRVTAAGVALLLDTWGVTKPVDARHVKPSDAPVPEGAPGHRKWAKGDRIEFQADDASKVVHATVVSGDMLTVKAVADGGESEYVVGTKGLRPSSRVLPVPAPSAMDDWGVRSYRAIAAMSEETDAFTADITYKGRKVISASNGGQGGCNRYQGDREVVARFEADAKAWFEEANVEHQVEAGDTWLHWHALERPYAVDAIEYLQRRERDLASAIYTPPSP